MRLVSCAFPAPTAVADLVRNVPRLIAYASSVMVSHPSALIATATLAGVGKVGDGDGITPVRAR